MKKSKTGRLSSGFGGVALADILANGVVVLLVVIILTLNIKQEQTEREIEQSAEISAILAREISSSLVFNDLPSSPPAVLHNYQCTNPRGPWRSEYERHDCLPWLYPIIEMHEGYLREYNSQRVFPKEILLDENNEFDAYLRTLPEIIKQRVRVDIYELDLYYLAISILQENGARPSHWHFLGEDATIPIVAPQDLQISEDLNQQQEQNNISDGLGDDFGGEDEESAVGDAGSSQQNINSEQIPDGVSLQTVADFDELLPPEVGLERGSSDLQQNEQWREDLASEFGSGDSYSDELAEALANALVDERSGESERFGEPGEVSIRFPGAGSQRGEQQEGDATSLFESLWQQLPSSGEGEPIEYHIFMILLIMEYLKEAQDVGFDRVSFEDTFARFVSGEVSLTNHPLRGFAENLRDDMEFAFQRRGEAMLLNNLDCAECLSRLWISANTPIDNVVLESVGGSAQRDDVDLINIRLRLYPYPDQGDETEILGGDAILIHPDTIASSQKGWYAAVITDPNLADIVVGYVYGDTRGGSFYAEGDVNSISLDRQLVLSFLPALPLRRDIILAILYGLLSLVVILFFFYVIGARYLRNPISKRFAK